VVIAGIMEHMRGPGALRRIIPVCFLTVSLSPAILETIRDYTKRLAAGPQVVRPDERCNTPFSAPGFRREVNPRGGGAVAATVPSVSKAPGAVAKVRQMMAGTNLPT